MTSQNFRDKNYLLANLLKSLFLFIFFGITPGLASERQPDKTIQIGAIAGAPQLLGLEVAYIGWPNLTPGITFGSAPINNIINTYFKINPITVNLSLPDTYNLYPVPSFSAYSGSAYLKYYFPKTGFSVGLMFSSMTFNANVSANLKDETTGAVLNSVVSGSANMTQLMLGTTVGYMLTIGPSFYIELSLGGGYLLPPSYSVTLGGTAPSALALVPSAAAAFDAAKAQVQTSFDQLVASYRAATKFIPYSFLSIGISF